MRKFECPSTILFIISYTIIISLRIFKKKMFER